MKRIISIILCLCMLLPVLSGCEMNVTLRDGVAMKGQTGQNANNGGTGDNEYVNTEEYDDEVIRIPIYSDEDWDLIEEWMRNDLYAEDYYEAIYGEYYDSPFDIVNEPMSRFDKYADFR